MLVDCSPLATVPNLNIFLLPRRRESRNARRRRSIHYRYVGDRDIALQCHEDFVPQQAGEFRMCQRTESFSNNEGNGLLNKHVRIISIKKSYV